MRQITSQELKISFENLIAVVENSGEQLVLTASVVDMLQSMYTWVVVDANMQISVPYGTNGAPAIMWPHGSRVDISIVLPCLAKIQSRISTVRYVTSLLKKYR